MDREQPTEKYPKLKESLLALTKELVEHIESLWSGDWSQQPPKMGIHFNYWDIKQLPSLKVTIVELGKIPGISEKYSESSLEEPIGDFLELVVSSVPSSSYVEKGFEYWWNPFVNLIEATEVPVKLYIGLSNFKSDQSEYRLDSETSICFYGKDSIESELRNSVNAPLPDPYPLHGAPLHLIHGAIKVEFQLPANRDTLEYGHYSHVCIKRMLPLRDAVCLSAFGRLSIGPWIPICNPPFPIDGVRVISSPEEHRRYNEPIFHFDDESWNRFMTLYQHLKRIKDEEEQKLEENCAARRRFNSAIARFKDTFTQGYWESVVVDLVITMESLLTPDRSGGRMQLALAASNLLGTNDDEVKEVFENVINMYSLRNAAVHGEPSTEEKWESSILEIAKVAGVEATNLNDGVREYAFEVIRDYTRRTISAMLNLHYNAGMAPSKKLAVTLYKLHLDEKLRTVIQSEAKCYPLIPRPKPPYD